MPASSSNPRLTARTKPRSGLLRSSRQVYTPLAAGNCRGLSLSLAPTSLFQIATRCNGFCFSFPLRVAICRFLGTGAKQTRGFLKRLRRRAG